MLGIVVMYLVNGIQHKLPCQWNTRNSRKNKENKILYYQEKYTR